MGLDEYQQGELLLEEPLFERTQVARAVVDPMAYQRIVIFFSGGKDSVATVLHLLELGVPKDRIELHHHLVDGREGSDLMDWPITEAYCDAFARALDLRISYSWKEGGFEREMLRNNEPTAPTVIPVDGKMVRIGGSGEPNSRLKFPQVSASLQTRWCSSYLKISVGAAYINNNPCFLLGKTLVVTGERAEESAARAKYKTFEPHRTDNRDGTRVKRWVDHWRPVHGWSEKEVWAIMERWRIAPHPAYLLGWGRCSCIACIFGSPDQWASVRVAAPKKFIRIANYERRFDTTIHRTLSVEQQADKGAPYNMDPRILALAMSTEYNEPIIVENWTLPAGAYGEGCGPT